MHSSSLSIRWFGIILVVVALVAQVAADEVANPPEVAGFWGQVTGSVISAQPDGPGFVLKITKAEIDPATTALKESAPLIGRELAIGVRMPKTDGVAHPHPEDVAYIKTLKPGMLITVKVFAPRANPSVLRIQGPGQSVQ